jgi:hypothetical protein
MKPAPITVDAKLRSEAISSASLSIGRGLGLDTMKMFSGGKPVDEVLRDELLAKCATGQYVELEVPMLAYEQQPDSVNKNYVRVRDGGMMAFGQSAKGNPFLRDHAQNDSTAVGGRITKSQTVKNGEGDYSINQTAMLTDPAMVARALRGLMSTVSISWRSTDGQVDCSACGTPVLTDCYHFPGDKLRQVENDGKKSFVRDRKNSTHTAQWIYNNVEHVETSEVPVPAVKNAKIDAIRNSVLMSAGLADDNEPDPVPALAPIEPPITEKKNMLTEEQIKSLQLSLDRANKVIELNDTEKAYFQRLGESEGDRFLAKSSADRGKMFEVVYTAKNGTVFTAADDKRLVEMAKQGDADKEGFAVALAAEKAKGLLSRTEATLSHLSGPIEARVALLTAVESIENAEYRTAALAALSEQDAKASKAFVRQGSGATVKGTEKAPVVLKSVTGANSETKLEFEAELQAMADELVANGSQKDPEMAYVVALQSDKGREIYSKLQHVSK